MRSVILIANIIALLTAFRLTAPAHAQQAATPAQRLYVIGVPSEMDAKAGKAIHEATLHLVLTARPAARIQVFDALNLQMVTDLTIPGGRQAGPKARVRRLANEIASLRTFFSRATSVRSGKDRQIRTPQFLELVGSTLKASSGDTTVIVFGMPYYMDERDASFTFGQGVYPSDGHILASSRESVFGTKDKGSLLKGVTLHFCYIEEVFDTELEKVAVRRFWKTYADGLGAVLATFAASPEVTLERARGGVDDPVIRDPIDRGDTVIEMRQIVGARVASDCDAALLSQIQRFQAERRWMELIFLIEQTMEREPTKWAQFAADLHEAYVEAAAAERDLAVRRERLTRVVEIAVRLRLDAKPAQQAIAGIDREMAHWTAFDEMVDELRARSAYAELVRRLQARLDERPQRSMWQRPMDELLLEAYVDHVASLPGGTCAELEHKQEWCRAGIAHANRWDLDVAALRRQLDAANAAVERMGVLATAEAEFAVERRAFEEAQRRENEARQRAEAERRRLAELGRPAVLPSGLAIHVVRLSADGCVITLDLAVETSDGRHHAGLRREDFAVDVNGAEIEELVFVPMEATAATLYLVIAIDVSSSTKGRPLSESIRGVQALLRDLEGMDVVVKIRTFSTRVDVVHDWTRDLMSASRAVEGLKARGNTALHAAVATGVNEFEGCDGRRRLLVYTDGRNTSGRVKLEPVFEHCRNSDIEISAIGLTTDQLDAAFLKRMAEATGGEYAQARSADDLTARFREASGRFRRSFYRLILAAPAGGSGNDAQRLTITIGRGVHALRVIDVVASPVRVTRAL
jgi:hypothetical protein